MAATDLLAEQHREAEDLLRRIKASTGGERVRLLGEVAEALTLHAALEERYFYPALKEYGMADVVDRSEREHEQVRRIISEIMDLKRSDPRMETTIARLEKAVTDHVREEEGEVFPRAKEKIEQSALEHAENAMRNAMDSLKDKELLEAADEGQAPAP